MRIQFIDMEVKPLPLRLLVIWIEYDISVVCSFYQPEVMAGLKLISLSLARYIIVLTKS
jgi:hypothetical protein